MRVLTGLDAVTRAPRRAAVTVGVFDGVHVGHQQLIRSTIRLARRLKGTSVVVTFDPDPQLVLHPASAPPALMPLEARLRHLNALGVDWVWVLPFSKRFARMSAGQFIRRLLIRRLRARALIVGDAFVFGKDRRGNTDVLQTFGPRQGMRIIPVKPITRLGIPVSSSRIRQLSHEGQLAKARQLLGRAPMLYGTVVRGAGRGRRLGFPTANIRLIPQVLPPRGVYAVIIAVAKRRWRGVMNLGMRPTFGTGPLVCEVHLLGFSGTLLRRPVTVALLARLRGERCFASPKALSRQVRRDILRAQSLLAHSRS
jgi:riboflavin kinase/FMN adenylyltransferase